MQITWNGREGKRGQDKSLLTIPIVVSLEGTIGRDLVLKPGINDGVSDADWAKAKEIELVRWYIGQGLLEEIKADTLIEYPVLRAVQMTKETIDMNLLNKWRKAELSQDPARTEVVDAINKQMTEMTAIPVGAQVKKV